GTHLFATERSIQPDEFAHLSEVRGFESVWFSEHTHIPVSFLSSGKRQPPLPDYYWQTYDPFIASTVAAKVTNSIKIGTGVSLVLEHDAISLAKTVATVDQISSGRFIFGVGAGWLAEEMENHGVRYRSRYRQLDEQIAAMKVIWTEAEAEYHGEFVSFSRIKSYPKPYQSPNPPIIGGGGTGTKTLEFIENHCDGWMPILGYPEWSEIKAGIADINQRLDQTDREPGSIECSIFCWSPPDERTIDDMEAHGIKKIVISLEAKNREESLPLLDEFTELMS
ncbi:MAG: TIGR03619 family F420-dependent LLM class oxidoreductase, partial [Anaerolineales bacterium]